MHLFKSQRQIFESKMMEIQPVFSTSKISDRKAYNRMRLMSLTFLIQLNDFVTCSKLCKQLFNPLAVPTISFTDNRIEEKEKEKGIKFPLANLIRKQETDSILQKIILDAINQSITKVGLQTQLDTKPRKKV